MSAARLALAVAAAARSAPASARADDSGLVSAKVGQRPLSDSAAAAKVVRSSFEPRPANARATHRVPTKAQLRAFHHQSDQPYSHWVTGRFRGTTDEVIQWAAAKWGLAPDLVRAVAAKETWWRMSTVGDNGDSFGLFQVRRPFHCRGTLRLRALPPRRGAQRRLLGLDHPLLLRRQADVAEHRRGQRRAATRAGDLWGSIGAWFSGRWHDAGSDGYVTRDQGLHGAQDLAHAGLRRRVVGGRLPRCCARAGRERIAPRVAGAQNGITEGRSR